MILRRVHIQNFRSIVDGGVVELGGAVTVFIGKNEQGKTNFLKALASFNSGRTFTPNDLPNHLRPTLEEKAPATIPVTKIWLEIEPGDVSPLRDVVPSIDSLGEIKVTRYFDGHFERFGIDSQGEQIRLEFSRPDISALVKGLKTCAEGLKTKLAAHSSRVPSFAPSVTQASTHIDQFVGATFNDSAQLDNLIATFLTALKGLPGQDQPIQDDIALTAKEVQAIHAELKTQLGFDPVNVFNKLIPRFVFHSATLDRIPDKVGVAEFIKDPESTSRGMANLCRAAGLATQKIQELASTTDTQKREAYEDHFRGYISGGLNEFWTQETYSVHFRIEKDTLSVSISDGTYGPRIAPSDRSDGFQWFLSFYTTLLREISTGEPTVILLDNPGLELHADGQRSIKRILEEKFAPTAQVIYVTHSPAMVDPYNLEQLRRVELHAKLQGTKVMRLNLDKAEDVDLLEPVRSAIGTSLVNSLMFDEFNVLVEGAADKPILEGAFKALKVGEYERIHVNGSISESGVFLPKFYLRSGLPFAVLVDGDSSGRKLADRLRSSGIPDSVIVDLAKVFPDEKGEDFELEDLISAELYHAAVKEAYPAKPVDQPQEIKGKRSRQYEELYKTQYAIGFSKKRVGETLKKLLLDGKADEATTQKLRKAASTVWDTIQKQVKPAPQGNVS